MFYVGAFVSYNGAREAHKAQIKKIEKLGHSVGRGERFLKQHPPTLDGDVKYRAMVLQMPDRFILRNDVIQHTMRVYKCDWATAKFHCYRLAATNVLGKQDVWDDVLTAAKEAEAALQSTAEPQPDVNPANAPIVNPEIDVVKP